MYSIYKHIVNRIRGWFKEESFKRLISNSGTLLIGETGASIINVVTLVILLKILGATEYGVIVLVQAYTTTIDQLVNFQSWQALIKFGAEDLVESNRSKLKKLIKQGTILDLGTAMLGAAIAFFLAGIIGNLLNWNEEVILFSKIYSISILFHFSGVPIGVLRLFNKFKIFSFQKVLVAAIKLFGVTVSYFLGADFKVIIFLYLISDVIGHLILIVVSYMLLKQERLSDWWKSKVEFRRDFMSYTLWTNLATTITIPSKQLDVFIVSSALSIETVGVYKVFKQIASLLSRLVSPIYQSIYPEFAIIIANRDIKKALKTNIKVSAILSAVIFPLIIFFSATSPWWLDVFFGEVFKKSWFAFSVFFFYVGLDTISSPIHPLFNALGYAKQKFIIMAIGNGMYLIIAWILGHSYGLIGIISAYGIQFMAITFSKLGYIKWKNQS